MVDRDKDVVRKIVQEELAVVEKLIRDLVRKELSDVLKEMNALHTPARDAIHREHK